MKKSYLKPEIKEQDLLFEEGILIGSPAGTGADVTFETEQDFTVIFG